MKILVISLLRVGDLILHHEIIKSIREKYPLGHISCLVNDHNTFFQDLLPQVNEWIVFPRQELQREMNHPQRWIFAPVLRLEKILQALKSEKYDQVINLTHNVISGHIAGYLDSGPTEVRGLCLNTQGKISFKSEALDFMNAVWSVDKEPLLHYVEILSLVSQYEVNFRASPVKSSSKGVLSFQISTSDNRKHFDFAKWTDIFKFLQKHLVGMRFQIVVAPFEEEMWRQRCQQNSLVVDIIPCTLHESIDVVRESDVFVTHDTSLLHLASHTSTPVVQLSLGASHIYKTSTLKHGSLVVTARKSCFPCDHQGGCHLPRFECHDDISGKDLLAAIELSLQKSSHELPSRMSQVQIVDGLWWLQNKEKRRNFSQKKSLYSSLGGHLKSELFLMEAQRETRVSKFTDAATE